MKATVKEKEKPPAMEIIPLRGGSGLLEPVASDEDLIAAFKRYNTLKERLLEETDFTWFSVYKIGEKTERKGFQKRDEAEKVVTDLRKRGIQADLEKKIKKSGCQKLSKAFGISVEILEEVRDREKGIASYRVRAVAPNGQHRE
ncbi:MAG: hypothetical protein ACRD1Z_05325, partial [Vicinamibacteria bacterium]